MELTPIKIIGKNTRDQSKTGIIARKASVLSLLQALNAPSLT
jgi:hypothetical protein